MSIFDALRQADARRRIDAAVSTYARRILSADTAYATALADPPVAETAASDLPLRAYWEGPIGMEDEMTGDARLIEGGALRWDVSLAAPLPMRWVLSDVGAHDGAEVAGSMLEIERRDGGEIWAAGDFDMTTDAGKSAYVAVRDLRQNGVSMDLDDVSFEIRVAGEIVAEMDAMMEDVLGDGDGEEPTEPERETDAEGRVTVVKMNSDDEVMVTTSARIRAATIVAVPAFANARIHLREEPVGEVAEEDDAPAALTAGGIPVAPPEAWFEPMKFSGPTALTVTPEGRIYGHLATWGSCHISHTAGGRCVTPPNSPSGYSWFHTGALETAEGSMLAVGHLTMSTGHAEDGMSPAETIAHYDNTGRVAGDVRAYEDEFGIAVVGAARPHLTPADLREFRAAPLSGDWRMVGGALELVGALSVNVPGFGVPRPHGKVMNDNLLSLVASGVIVKVEEETVDHLSDGDVAWLRSFVARGKRAEIDALAARRTRVKVEALAARRRLDKRG